MLAGTDVSDAVSGTEDCFATSGNEVCYATSGTDGLLPVLTCAMLLGDVASIICTQPRRISGTKRAYFAME